MDERSTLESTIEAFTRARGQAGDMAWAQGVAWRLLRRDVDPDLVREGLEEGLALVVEAQEPPEALFGTAEEHADALWAQWVEEGRLRLIDPARTTWREVPSTGLLWGAWLCVAFLFFFLLDGQTSRTWTVGMVLVPVGMGVAAVAAQAVWTSLLPDRGTVVAAVAAAGVVGGSAAAIGLVNDWTRDSPLVTASTWWYLVVATAAALLAAAWRAWTDTWPTAVAAGIGDVGQWSRELAAILRVRYSMSETRVGQVVGEAHAHAADAGRPVGEEFGTPEEYAARFAPDEARRARLGTAFHLAVAAASLVYLAAAPSWSSLALAAGWSLLAWRQLRCVRRARGDDLVTG